MRLPVTNRRKVGMTSSPHGPYGEGFTRHTMVGTEGRQPARGSQSQKPDRSPDCRLQLACMKSESLVIADQHVAVNTFPGLVHTARHTMGVGFTSSKIGRAQFGTTVTNAHIVCRLPLRETKLNIK